MNRGMEEIIDDFYKLYYKIEKLNVDNSIKCLTANEMHIISAISNDSITMNDLADRLGITIGTASSAVSKLEKKLFIRREKDKEDKRKVYLSLTKKGEISLDFQGNFNKTLFQAITKNIDKKDLKTFEKVFRKMTSSLYSIKEKLEPVNIVNLNVGDKAIVDEIRATEENLRQLLENSILIGKELEIIRKTKELIVVKVDLKEININSENAQSIFVIKKDRI